MPRRKSTQSSSQKRPLQDEYEFETASGKILKLSDGPVGDTTTLVLQESALSRTQAHSQDSGSHPPHQAKGRTGPTSLVMGGAGGGEEMVVLTRTLPPTDTVLGTATTTSTTTNGGSKSSRSLDALLKVTHSELQSMRQDPQTSVPTPPPSTSAITTTTTPQSQPAQAPPPTPLAPPAVSLGVAVSSVPASHIVVLGGVGQEGGGGVKFIITQAAPPPPRPLHHHKAAILQHHQQQQQRQSQQPSALLPQGVIMAPVPAPGLGEEYRASRHPPVTAPGAGPGGGTQRMKLVYTKHQAHGSSSHSSFASTSTSRGSTISLDASDDGGSLGSVDKVTSSSVAAIAASVGLGRRKKPVSQQQSQKPGRYICNFCGRGCAKPSVLRKHLRAHTGERPYPCHACGFSFKTKSNLYKHHKSLAHSLRAGHRPGEASTTLAPLEDTLPSRDPDPDPDPDAKARHDVEDLLSEGDSEKTESDLEASVEEEEVTVVREETLPLRGPGVRPLALAVRLSPTPPPPATVAFVSGAAGLGGAVQPGVAGVTTATTTTTTALGGGMVAQQVPEAYDRRVREESILENIRLKIDKRKLLEWSRQMDRLKHQEHVDQLQVHSKFPVRIAPKVGAQDAAPSPPPSPCTARPTPGRCCARCIPHRPRTPRTALTRTTPSCGARCRPPPPSPPPSPS